MSKLAENTDVMLNHGSVEEVRLYASYLEAKVLDAEKDYCTDIIFQSFSAWVFCRNSSQQVTKQ